VAFPVIGGGYGVWALDGIGSVVGGDLWAMERVDGGGDGGDGIEWGGVIAFFGGEGGVAIEECG
jgi:hypothetical protein